MHRVVSGGLAVLAGLITTVVTVWLVLGGPGTQDSLGWAMILSMFLMPVFVGVFPLALLALEALSTMFPRGRSWILLAGALALPFAVAVYLGVLQVPVLTGRPDDADVPNALIMSIIVGSAIPAFAMCGLYALLTSFGAAHRREPEQSRQSATPVAKPPPPPASPRRPLVQLNLSLSFPTTSASERLDTHRLVELLTSPDHRIGQQHFLVVMGVLGLASQVWFPLPFVLGGLLRLDQDVRIALALFGWLVLFWGAFCAIGNRLHDLGMSAVWAITPMLAALAWLLIEGEPRLGWTAQTALFHWVIATLICSALAAAALLLFKGEPWSNRFGSEQA